MKRIYILVQVKFNKIFVSLGVRYITEEIMNINQLQFLLTWSKKIKLDLEYLFHFLLKCF